jgi:hypothetical protein
METIEMAHNRYMPAPWLSVILATFPGLLIALTRRRTALVGPLLLILGSLYLGLLVLAPPIIWWKRRRFPVWALLPTGTLIWFLTYKAGVELVRQVGLLHVFDLRWSGVWIWITFINLVLSTALFVVLLRGRRVPGYAWLVFGIIVLSDVLMATIYSLTRYGSSELLPGMLQYLTTSGLGFAEGLILVAVGLLAARQHGVLAILVVVGGYSYMCLDSDYLFGYRYREWIGLPAYLVAVTISFMVVVPVALLRTRTRLRRALAVFVPVVIFHVARFTIPLLVIQQPVKVRPGDVVTSTSMVLSLVLAWALYSHIGDASRDAQPSGSLAASPLSN